MTRKIDNRTARRLLLDLYGLSRTPRRKIGVDGLAELIGHIGFVQLDSIDTVARAHHMILRARNDTYEPALLRTLLEKRRGLFEAWTHDASVVPVEFWPFWKRRFERERQLLLERWRIWRRDPFEDQLNKVLAHVRANGPVMSRELRSEKKRGGSGWWDWHPSKTALEYLWRTGELAVLRREGFQKVYDLTERVLPACEYVPDHESLVDWSCRSAFERMGFATPTELAGFWDNITRADAAEWCAAHASELVSVEVEAALGGRARPCLLPEELASRLEDLPEPSRRVRVLSPFDPLIRDRRRTSAIFGFDYRIEVFVPEEKRRYGYYVFPLLEADGFIGRIDMRRDGERLRVDRLWLEPGIRSTKGRRASLEAELSRVARFAGCSDIEFRTDALVG